jgi:SPW repeat
MTKYSHAMQVRSASGINVLLGCWLIASPWVFGYTVNGSGFWNSIAAGALVALLAASRFSSPRSSVGSSWWNLLLGLWIIASPWIYGYVVNGAAMWDCIAVGAAIAVLATWSGRTTAAESPGGTRTTATH